jgi:ribonuclease Z
MTYDVVFRWLFDCGEGSQLKVQQSSSVSVGSISKIFISHLHGDHLFGIPAMLCLLGAAAERKEVERCNREVRSRPFESLHVDDVCIAWKVVDIFGPEGIRDFIRATMQLSSSRVVVPHRIHELKGLPNTQSWNIRTTLSKQYGEVGLGKDIYPDKDGIYHLVDSSSINGVDATVMAASMAHRVACAGFVVHEKERSGRLNAEYVQPLLKKHRVQLSLFMKPQTTDCITEFVVGVG